MINYTELGVTEEELETLLSRTKTRLFIQKGAAFLGCLLSQTEFIWDDSIDTACTNGLWIKFNPKFFLSLPEDSRITVLVHELWHIGYGHCLPSRVNGREPENWNIAADHVINLSLEGEKYSFLGLETTYKDKKFNNMMTEQVYSMLPNPPKQPNPSVGAGKPSSGSGTGKDPQKKPNALSGDVQTAPVEKEIDVISKVVQAAQMAAMSNQAGDIPGEIQLALDAFLNPKVPWEVLLRRFFTERSNDDFSLRRPNRRHDDIYLSSLISDNGLTTINYYLDVSGSVSDGDILRFNSEVAHIKNEFMPEHLNLITFDTKIRDIYYFGEAEPFEKIVVTGRGGTDLGPVRKHILKTQPNVAVIFSDLFVAPMASVGDIPVIWITVGNPNAVVPFGEILHIDNE